MQYFANKLVGAGFACPKTSTWTHTGGLTPPLHWLIAHIILICMCRLVETMCIERINECPHAVGAYRIRPEYIRVDKWTHSGVCDTPLHGMFANIQ